jgi:hypothetical protein
MELQGVALLLRARHVGPRHLERHRLWGVYTLGRETGQRAELLVGGETQLDIADAQAQSEERPDFGRHPESVTPGWDEIYDMAG